MKNLKFPIGKVEFTEYSEEIKEKYIQTIDHFHESINTLTTGLSDKDLLKTYRPGGWNIRQLVHHCADSHMSAYIRFKLALTEINPVIKPYEEAAWAELADNSANISFSLSILKGVHHRWAVLLKSLTVSEFDRTFYHPESEAAMSLWEALAMYDWHARHHLAHIEIAKRS